MRAAVLLNGEPPSFDVAPYLRGRTVICADGAAAWARERGAAIDALIGDFDSSSAGEAAKVVLRYPADKDATDGQLCLDYALRNGASDIVILGGGGGRDDHYLGNLTLLLRARRRGVSAVMVTETSVIACADSEFTASAKPGSTVSIVPISEGAHIMNTEGLKYALSGKTLSSDETLGISNVATRRRIAVSVSEGAVLVIRSRE